MAKRKVGQGAVGWAVGALLAAGLLACSSGGGESAPSTDPRSIDPAVIDPEVVDSEAAPADTDEVNYQFVDTADGMTIEAISGDQVQSLSCPTRTCAGLCDECAAAACRAVGQLGAACERLAADCSSACTCSGVDNAGPNSCGFPVCDTNPTLCYIGTEASRPGLPGGPVTDPAPETIRPSSASEAASSSGSSANAASPAG